MKIKLALMALLFGCFSCSSAQQQQPDFSFKDYKAVPATLATRQDSSIAFVNYILDDKYEEAEIIYPEMFKIDVSAFMNRGPGYEPYLGDVGEFVLDYKTSHDIMSLTVFLENKYNAHNNVYDMGLRASLRKDSTNVAAMLLLAKLRYENGIADDAYFIVQQMMKQEPENEKVRELHTWFQDNHEPIGSNLPSFDAFIKEEVYYRE
ncbi:hypothetical protein [Pontibacter anaerobius]|uniref:Uncharacterized protein n=1 Tax=Pontibacter anaerobius TaxID=2993940 RepID=A0ABT3RBB3_9BACT|nr:hypothetical protein [Pontibacter anaerobius]MCX2738673.1 hypothetical protein [Pontibacter anaerobius]